MPNVWKVGSRWSDNGTKESSIISIFRRNNVVFVGTEQAKRDLQNKVKIGDYLAIADGYNVVAVAKVLDTPKAIKEFNLIINDKESQTFDVEVSKEVIGVRIKIFDLPVNQRIWYKNRTAFCQAHQIKNQVIDLFDNQNQNFQINSYTSTLTKTHKDYNSILDNHTRYIIPVYQRPYSWSENEIRPFIKDVFKGFYGKDLKALKPEPMFIGTMQLSEKKYIDTTEYEQEVIDGQQRITTLSILLKVLSIKFPENDFLKQLKFDWLETRVNKEQSSYLIDFFKSTKLVESDINLYVKNGMLINQIIYEIIDKEEPSEDNVQIFQIDKFINYLCSSVYFVIIETFAGLSKTLQIFNTINTTGLDLNGGDLFKIRMYEYLKDKKQKDENAFKEISEIYQLIDEKNKQSNRIVTNIQHILSYYQDYLIGKYDLPNELFKYNWETFFESLFDTILGIKTWQHYEKVLDTEFELSLEELKDLVNSTFEIHSLVYQSNEEMFAHSLIGWSRYGKYRKLKFLFNYVYRDEPKEIRFQKLNILYIKLNKLFFIYSVIYDKGVNEIHTFINRLQKSIASKIGPLKTMDDILIIVNEKLNDFERNHQNRFEDKLAGYINNNAKRKNLICCLSAYLDEIEYNITIDSLQSKLFNNKFDIEHIHANADTSIVVNETLQNSIGNLVMLEASINRAIKDVPFNKKSSSEKCKKDYFSKSAYCSVLKISKFDNWNEISIHNRKDIEVSKMMKYLFNNE